MAIKMGTFGKVQGNLDAFGYINRGLFRVKITKGNISFHQTLSKEKNKNLRYSIGESSWLPSAVNTYMHENNRRDACRLMQGVPTKTIGTIACNTFNSDTTTAK